MPSIDVSTEVVLDGVVAAVKFAVIRRRSWTNKNGLEQHSNRRIFPVYGSLFPGGDNRYDREDSLQLMNKGIEVVTQFPMRSVAETRGGVQWQPDIVVWADATFLVSEVRDYGDYGPGFVHVMATSFDYTGPPPAAGGPHVGQVNFGDRRYSGLIGALR